MPRFLALQALGSACLLPAALDAQFASHEIVRTLRDVPPHEVYEVTVDGPAKRAFREGYEGVRSLPAGIQRRRPVYAMLNEVSYLESLFVQDRHEPEETQARATWLRERIIGRLEELS